MEYVESIKADVRWLGFAWAGEPHYASDYFERLYDFAVALITRGKAYVDSLTAEEIREYRGTLTEPGKNSPYRERTVEENLDLFARMRAGEFPYGAHVLRAKIDMASPNIVMRDPAIFRIRHAHHHRTGDAWCVYPLYDFTHCLSDMLEGITHSICTLEFENNRELYDWVLDTLQTPCHPRQYEFARLNMTHTVLSKRRLIQLVEEGHVAGWDDPRMPTISGMRRRGYPAAAIRTFCERIGVSRSENRVEFALLEHCVREELNRTRPGHGRGEAAQGGHRELSRGPGGVVRLPFNPRTRARARAVPFSREIYIEQDDFRERRRKNGSGWRRAEVRLRYAYYLTCTGVKRNADGAVVELTATIDPESRGGWTKDGRKVKGTLHWLSRSMPCRRNPALRPALPQGEPMAVEEGQSFKDNVNRLARDRARLREPSLAEREPATSASSSAWVTSAWTRTRERRAVFNRGHVARHRAKIEAKG